MKFIRFGGVNCHSARERYSRDVDDFHRAPARRGIYAFPAEYGAKPELFLVIWKYKNKMEDLPDREAKRKMFNDLRSFEYGGLVWHHLGRSAKTLMVEGSWALDDTTEYDKKLRRRMMLEVKHRMTSEIEICGDDLEVFIEGKAV